jgi:glycosyltransferase involved in cell wall biosynthesis
LKLAIIITHPIRYFIPLVQLLNKKRRIELKLFFTYGPDLLRKQKYNPAYREKAEPALPLFEGYDYEFIENIAKNKSTYHFKGIINPSLISKIVQWQPDALLVCGWKFHSHLQAMRHFKGKVPVYFRGDSTLLDEGSFSPLKKIIRKIALTWVFRYIDKALYTGTNNKHYYEKFGLKKDQLIYIPHAVDNSRFTRTLQLKHEALELRRKMNIRDDDIVFLYAGSFTSAKGVFHLLNSFIKAKRENIHLLFTGAGTEEARLKALAGGRPDIHFLPYQTQTMMPLIYSTSEVLIHPSGSDTWGLVINEAMANGLAIIASDKCGGATDLVEEGKNGYIFPAGDINALTSLIIKLADDQNKTAEMGRYSKEKIRSFSYEIASTAIENLLTKNNGSA